jgi:hypothetical protein
LNSNHSLEWRRKLVLGFLVIALYWLYGWHPFLIQTWLAVDDGLYVRHAEGFLSWIQRSSGRWLGSFDCFLLAKTPLYGVWLAFLHILGLPLRVGEFLLMLAGGLLFKRAVRPVRELRLWEFAVALCLLLANPFLPEDFRLARFGLQIALTNLCLIATLGLSLRAQAATKERRSWGLLTGVFFGLAYLNREDATWIVLAILVAFAIQGLAATLAWRCGNAGWRSLARSEVFVVLCFATGGLAPILTVCTLNKAHYGAFTTTFRRNSALTGLYQRLTSLEPTGHQPYVPIARATRLKAYALSPTFAKMQPFLEGTEGYWHAGNEHSAMNRRNPADKEFFVSYFEFCLLWAAEKIGAKDAGEMESIFRAIDRELSAAVREKKIVAGASGPAILAAPVAGDFRRIVAAVWVSFSSLLFVTRDGYAIPGGNQDFSPARIETAGRLTYSWVALFPKPATDYALRGPILGFMRRVQRMTYPLLFLSLPGLLVWKRKEALMSRPSPRTILLWSMLIPIAGLLAFCVSMAVVDVLGFRFLAGVGYDVLGFSPLTVLCAFAFTALVVFVSRSPQDAVMQEGAASASDSQ